jgi:hypothetical protein
VSWIDFVREYLRAKKAWKLGDRELLQQYVMQRQSKFWRTERTGGNQAQDLSLLPEGLYRRPEVAGRDDPLHDHRPHAELLGGGRQKEGMH